MYQLCFTSDLQRQLVNLHVLKLSLAALGVVLHGLVVSHGEDEVGLGDATTIYEEFHGQFIHKDIYIIGLLAV